MAIEACPTCTPRLTTATAAFCDHCAARLPKDTPFADNHGTLLCQACAPAHDTKPAEQETGEWVSDANFIEACQKVAADENADLIEVAQRVKPYFKQAKAAGFLIADGWRDALAKKSEGSGK